MVHLVQVLTAVYHHNRTSTPISDNHLNPHQAEEKSMLSPIQQHSYTRSKLLNIFGSMIFTGFHCL
jgi:hypothetical protein